MARLNLLRRGAIVAIALPLAALGTACDRRDNAQPKTDTPMSSSPGATSTSPSTTSTTPMPPASAASR